MKMLKYVLAFSVLVLAISGCGNGEEAVTTESAANAAQAGDASSVAPDRAGVKEQSSGNKGTGGMPEGAGRPPIGEGGDLAKPSGG